MSERRDMDSKMIGPASEDEAIDRLFRGGISPEDAAPEYRLVTSLFRAATGPATESELAAESAVVTAAAAEIRATVGPRPLAASGLRRGRSRSARFAAAGMAGAVVLGGTAAAAATNSLPAPAQTAVSDALSDVGISVPKPNPHANKHAFTNPGHSGTAPGHSRGHGPNGSTALPGNSTFGLCTAFLAGPQDGSAGSRNSSTAFARLIASVPGGTAAATKTYCQGVVANHAATHPSGTSDDQQQGGKPDDTGQPSSGNKSSAGSQSSDAGKPANPGPPASVGPQDSSSGLGSHGSSGTTPGASNAHGGSAGTTPASGAAPSVTTTSTAPTSTTSTTTSTG